MAESKKPKLRDPLAAPGESTYRKGVEHGLDIPPWSCVDWANTSPNEQPAMAFLHGFGSGLMGPFGPLVSMITQPFWTTGDEDEAFAIGYILGSATRSWYGSNWGDLHDDGIWVDPWGEMDPFLDDPAYYEPGWEYPMELPEVTPFPHSFP